MTSAKNKASNELDNFCSSISGGQLRVDTLATRSSIKELSPNVEATIIEEDEEKSMQSGGDPDGSRSLSPAFERRGSPTLGSALPVQRWEKQMNANTEQSMKDSHKNIRDCCSMHAEAFLKGNRSFLSVSLTQKEYLNGAASAQNAAMRTLNRGKSAGISRATMTQKKLNKNFAGLASTANLGGASTAENTTAFNATHHASHDTRKKATYK